MKGLGKLVLAAIVMFLPLLAEAKILLPSIIDDNMVLQQQSEIMLWGSAEPDSGIQVSVSWDGKTYKTMSDGTGKWSVKCRTIEAGGPYEITIRSGKEKVVLTNVMLGEVWLCGGQSNMDISFRGLRNQPIADAAREIIDSEYPDLRLFRVKRNYNKRQLDDVTGDWCVSTSSSAETCSAIGFIFGRMLHLHNKVPVGIIVSAWGGSKVEAWMSEDKLKAFVGDGLVLNVPDKLAREKANVTPTVLYNAMINPIVNYKIKGCLFYQGEANITRPALYRKLFPAMVQEWREKWGYEFPFYYVQLAPFGYQNMGWSPEDRQVAFFREVQEQSLKDIPNAGIISTTDVGALHTIHPPQKKEVAERALFMALKNTYGYKGFVAEAPVPKTVEINGNKVSIQFANAPYGISSYGRPMVGFEVAGKDKVFYPAEVSIYGLSTIHVSSASVPEPVAVRYCFKNFYEGCIYNNYGIPALPFRTDDWAE